MLEKFIKKYDGWEGMEVDPWINEDPYSLQDGVRFPSKNGVYMFVGKSPYYIGSAPKQTLQNRLKKKLTEDRNTKYRGYSTLTKMREGHCII